MSTVQPSTLHIPSGLPIDQGTRREHSNASQTNRMARNARSPERGAIEKRLGTSRLSRTRLIAPLAMVGTSRTSGVKLFSHQGTPTVIDADGYVDSWSEPLGGWVVRGRASEVDYSVTDVPASPGYAGAPVDSEACGDYLCTVYTEVSVIIGGTPSVGQAYASVLHLPTGTVVRAPETLNPQNCTFAQVAQFDDRYFVACTVDTSGSIAAFILDTQAMAAGWSTLVVSVVATTTSVTDAVMSMCSMGDRVALAFIGTTAQKVQIRTLNASGIVSSANASGAVAPVGVDVAWAPGVGVWLAQAGGTVSSTTYVQLYSTTLVAIGGSLTLTGGSAMRGVFIAAGPGVARTWSYYSTTPSQTQSYTGSAGASALSGSSDNFATASALMSTRPFYRSGRYYAFFKGILADWSSVSVTSSVVLRPVASVFPGLIGSGHTGPRSTSKITAWGSKWVVVLALNSGTNAVGFNGGAFSSRAVIFDFAATTRSCTAEHHGVTAIGGGLTQQYDGDRVHELGFLVSPRITNIALSAGTVTGTGYRYVAVYEDVDAHGNIAVSGVSEVSAATTLATQRATVSVSNLQLTSRRRFDPSTGVPLVGALRVTLYRTLASGAPPYYRVGSAVMLAGSTATTIIDDTTDANLQSAPLLYAPNLPGAAGESLDRRAPPGLQNLVSYNGMLVGSRESSVYNSGQPVYGEATWFSPLFETPLPSGEDDITALASLDGTLFPMKKTEIFAMIGEAPSDNGAAGGMGPPRRLSSDCGCIESRSVVSTSMGAFFQSERGIELLNRSQTVEFIGEAVQATQADYPTTVAATLDSKHSLVRIAMTRTDEFAQTTGITLVYDLTLKYWVSVDSMPLVPASAACTVSGGASRYTWLSTTGYLYAEKLDGENDSHIEGGATWITLEFTTSPIHFGLQQEQRVYEFMLLYEMNSEAGIEVQIAHDYGAFGGVDTGGKFWSDLETAGKIQLPFRPLKPRNGSMELLVRDTQKSGFLTGSCKGPTFIGISTDIAVKVGNTRGTPRTNAELRR